MQTTKQKQVKNRRTDDKDIELLTFLSQHQIKEAAVKFHLSETAIRSKLYRLRKRITKTQSFLNNIRALQKKSSRVRKLTSDGSVPETLADEEEVDAKS